jgi:hypothetical protein
MTNLSPAAQAVMDAAEPCDELESAIAAALRALAVRIPDVIFNGADAIRQDILDIADELEGAQ